MTIRFVCLNARGLMSKDKFNVVKELCKNEEIILLQETNWKNEVMEDFKKRWKGEMFYNNGDGRMGRGVAILIRENVDFEAIEMYNDMKGKCNAIEIRQEENVFVLMNVHAPTDDKEKKEYFDILRTLMEKWKTVVVAGDFNTVFNKRDMADGMVFKSDQGRKELVSLMKEKNMVDVWRERNENRREFSRRQLVGNFMCQTRIDFILSTRDIDCFIEDVFYKETSLSDHKMVLWNVDFNKKDKGPGNWILNTGILREESYKMGIVNLLEKERKDGMYLEDKRIWWENVKYEIKKFSIKYSKCVQKARKAKEMRLRKTLREELKKEQVNTQRIVELEDNLKKIEEEKCKGAMLRSKAKYTIEGEKCTKFFFDLERRRGKAEIIKELKNKNGESVKGTAEILREVKNYYEELFKENGMDEQKKRILLQQIKLRVGKEDKIECDKEISQEEIIEAINLLKSRKSPGIDGLVNEFYKVFKEEISLILKELYEDIFKRNELNQMMSLGLMKIAYKRKGDRALLKNFRPITMLNTDLKILTKILSNRLKNVLPKIIETNQAYGVTGRDIADTTSSIRDIVSFLNEKNRNGYLISLDFEKAFDRVEHGFLFSILECFGFGRNFIKWVRILYSDIMTKVKCNGFLTEPFKISRSIRQGCPLSAQLYSLVAEPLGLIIKKEEKIKGVQIEEGQEDIKIFQYADDTTLIAKDIQSVKNAMEKVEWYCQGSGAKINEEKTIFMKFGNVPELAGAFNFTEVQEAKILGVLIGKDEKCAREQMWEGVVYEVERRLNFWRSRCLNLKGKILIVNVLMLSKMWYVLSVSSVPMWVEQRLKRCVLEFLWEKKPPRVAYNTLIGQVKDGGLGLVDMELKKKSMRIKIIKKFMDEQCKGDWKLTMNYFLNECGNLKLGENILWMKLKNWMIQGMPEFYKEVLRDWGFFLTEVDFKPKGREMVLNQPLFLNKYIVSQGKELYFKKWIDVGFLKLRDVLYEFKKGFLPIQVIIDAMEEGKEEYRVSTLKKQYDEVKKAIPKEWMNEIQSGNEKENKLEVFVKVQEKMVDFKSCHVRRFYQYFRNAVFKKPVANQLWLRLFKEIEENDIWKNTRWVYLDSNLECLEYFIRHNVVFTGMRLVLIGKDQDAICRVCKKEDEGILHLFLFCEKLGNFFNVLKEIIKNLRGKNKDVSWNTMLMFGCNEKCKNRKVINLLLILAKSAIWKRRNIAKNMNFLPDLWLLYKMLVEDYIQTLFIYFRMENMEEVFYQMFTNDVYDILMKRNIDLPKGHAMLTMDCRM